MSKVLNISIGIFAAVVAISLALSSCGVIIGPLVFSQHRFQIVNDTEAMIWVDYHVENRVLDTTRGLSRIDFVISDTAFIIEPGRREQILMLQFGDFQRNRLEMEDINRRIYALELFQIDGQDTLPIDLDGRIESDWEYHNSDPISFVTRISHFYELHVLPVHLN